jgi:hypothetical protein
MTKNLAVRTASDLGTARADFLARVEGWAGGQAARFAPVLDELIRWSDGNGLEYAPHPGVHHLVKYRLPGGDPFWAVAPRTGDGAKLTLLCPRSPGPLRDAARDELARINGAAAKPDGNPEVAFTKLIWEPHRRRVLDLMARLLTAARGDDQNPPG